MKRKPSPPRAKKTPPAAPAPIATPIATPDPEPIPTPAAVATPPARLYAKAQPPAASIYRKAASLAALAVALCLLCALPGCSSPPKGNDVVPSSHLKIPTPAGQAELQFPKDDSIEEFHYARSTVDTNGVITNVVVNIKGLKAANSPEVVMNSWAGTLAAIQAQQAAQNARLEMFMQMTMFGLNKAGAYFGLPQTPIPTNAPKTSP